MHHFKKYWELHGTRRPFPALYEAVRMYGAENVYFDKPEYEKEKQVILFGEGYGNKIQSGGKYCKDNKFILFDVYMPQADLWLERDSIEEIAKALGIDCVPIVFKCTIEKGIKFVKQKPKSTIGTANMEGIVCKPAVDLLSRTNKRIIVKIKVKDFC